MITMQPQRYYSFLLAHPKIKKDEIPRNPSVYGNRCGDPVRPSEMKKKSPLVQLYLGYISFLFPWDKNVELGCCEDPTRIRLFGKLMKQI